MKIIIASLFALALALAPVQSAHTIMYPSKDNADFSVTVPEDWEFTPGNEEGDYFTVTGPTGIHLEFRSINPSSEDVEAGIQESLEEMIGYLGDNYSDVKFDKPQQGDDYFMAVGTGKANDGGQAVVFLSMFFVMPNKKIAEIWYETDADDKEGQAQAEKVLKSFQPGK